MSALQWKRICCPVDFSEPSRAAMRVAAGLAQCFGAELTLLHAYDIPGYSILDATILPSPQTLQEQSDRIDKLLGEFRAEAERLGAPSVNTDKVQGPAFLEIVRFAREGAFDVVVMGTHGRAALKHALMGSVAEKVVRKAPCPVLTVRPPDHRFEMP
jgi:nucleotide-binding universal stress UspA family protein